MVVYAVGNGSSLPDFGTRLCAVRLPDGTVRLPKGDWADLLEWGDVVSTKYVCKVCQTPSRLKGDTSGFSGLLGGEYVLEVVVVRRP